MTLNQVGDFECGSLRPHLSREMVFVGYNEDTRVYTLQCRDCLSTAKVKPGDATLYAADGSLIVVERCH